MPLESDREDCIIKKVQTKPDDLSSVYSPFITYTNGHFGTIDSPTPVMWILDGIE
jgi:hypothetical protein